MKLHQLNGLKWIINTKAFRIAKLAGSVSFMNFAKGDSGILLSDGTTKLWAKNWVVDIENPIDRTRTFWYMSAAIPIGWRFQTIGY
jgi:hypothetical protein